MPNPIHISITQPGPRIQIRVSPTIANVLGILSSLVNPQLDVIDADQLIMFYAFRVSKGMIEMSFGREFVLGDTLTVVDRTFTFVNTGNNEATSEIDVGSSPNEQLTNIGSVLSQAGWPVTVLSEFLTIIIPLTIVNNNAELSQTGSMMAALTPFTGGREAGMGLVSASYIKNYTNA